jgi:hypothetical protein
MVMIPILPQLFTCLFNNPNKKILVTLFDVVSLIQNSQNDNYPYEVFINILLLHHGLKSFEKVSISLFSFQKYYHNMTRQYNFFIFKYEHFLEHTYLSSR